MKVNINAKEITNNTVGEKIKLKLQNFTTTPETNPGVDIEVPIFLASSEELVEDRKAFEIFLSRENQDYIKEGVFLKLIIWENFLDAISKKRLQDEYNKAIKSCDIFIMLFSSKVGKYTFEEFQTAYSTFKNEGKPLIFTYFKAPKSNSTSPETHVQSVAAFKEKLKSIGHFYTNYKNTEDLMLHFSGQLKKINLKNSTK